MAQLANTDHLGFHHVARPEPFLRIASGAHACGRAGRDDVTRFQTDALAYVGNQIIDLEQHVPSVRTLLLHPFHGQPEVQNLWIRNFIRGHDARTNGGVAVLTLGIDPLNSTLEALGIANVENPDTNYDII